MATASVLEKSDTKERKARKTVLKYTVAAASTGAIPVPASSFAIVAEDAAMITHVGHVMGTPVTVETVVSALGVVGTINIIGRNLFIEGAKLLSWGTGSVWAAVGLSTLGASTAGLQTWILGNLAIAIVANDGKALERSHAKRVIADARASYDDVVAKEKLRMKKT